MCVCVCVRACVYMCSSISARLRVSVRMPGCVSMRTMVEVHSSTANTTKTVESRTHTEWV